MTVLNILNERSEFSILCEGFIRGHKVQSTRDQVSIRILRYYVIKAAVSFVKFFLPLLGKDNRMGNNNPYPPLPSLIREGADISHSEALRGETIQPIENNKQNTCGNASLIPPYVLEVKGSKGVDENQPSPQPSPIGDGVSNSHPELVSGSHLVQQQVKHNANSLKRTYSPIHLFTHSLKKRAAFTLAEVLITLGIIGVVAAMTMPALIANYKNKEFAVRAKRTYSVISQAIKLYEAENETPGDVTGLFDTSKTSKEVLTNFSKYFDGAKLCLSPSKDCKMYAHNVLWASPLYDENSSAFADTSFTYYPAIILKDGSMILLIQHSSCSRTETANQYDSDGKVVVDKDGNPVTYTITSNFCAQVAFDTNGNSAPNQYGADVFSLRVREDGTFTGWGKSGWDSLKNILNGGNPIYTKYAEGQKKD